MRLKLVLSSAALLALFAALPIAAQNATQEAAQTPAELCAASISSIISSSTSSSSPAEPAAREFESAEQVLEPGTDYRAIFCTGVGAVYVDLFEQLTPITVNNFVFLAEQGYYNDTTFHRVIEDFMVQGGDPTATGTGGPGYQFEDEFVGFLTFSTPGLLAMANAGPGTNGSQFFITTAATEHLNNRHTIFGQVLEGQDVVEDIRLRDPQTDPEPGTSLDSVLIITDAASVMTAYEAPVSATQGEVAGLIEQLGSSIQAPLALDSEHHGIFLADDVAASAGEANADEYAQFLADHDFEYRASTGLINEGCDTANVPFFSVRYTLDSFATRDDASEALQDGFLQTLPSAEGFTEYADNPLPNTVWTKDVTACDQAAISAITHWQRGHFVVTAEATYPADSAATPDLYLTELVGSLIYEAAFAPVLRPEI